MDRKRFLFVTTAAALGLLSALLGERSCVPRSGPEAHTVPRRIVALSPGIAEILFALQCGPRVVGITEHTHFPPEETKGKVRVGGFLAPNLERILALAPDLVVCRAAQPELVARLRRAGLNTLAVRDDSLQSLLVSVARIGAAVGAASRAERLAATMKRRFDDIGRRARRRRRVTALLAVGRADDTLRALYVASPKTLLGQLLELAGGQNTVGRTTASFPLISREAVAAADPEVIVEVVAPPSPFGPEQVRKSWASLPSLRAVRNGRVFVVRDDAWLIPGPRLTRVAEKLYSFLHGPKEER